VEAEQEAGKREPFLPSENLKKLYREVAKRIHPDLATDESERQRRHELMTEANRAFAEGDAARLEAILRDWESSPESVKGEGPGAELVRVIRKIAQVEDRLKAIDAEIARLEESDLYRRLAQSASSAFGQLSCFNTAEPRPAPARVNCSCRPSRGTAIKRRRSERKARRSFDTAIEYVTVATMARERTGTATSTVRAT